MGFFVVVVVEVYLIYYFVLVSGVQKSDSVIHIHVSILFQILLPFRLLHNIEQSVLIIDQISLAVNTYVVMRTLQR